MTTDYSPHARETLFLEVILRSDGSVLVGFSPEAAKFVSITTGGITIPANASVAFPVGTVIVIYNNRGGNQNISITADTLRLAGTATTGTRVLASAGVASLMKVGTNAWTITGADIS